MTPQLVLALSLAGVVGLSLGLLGSGGSIVTLPVLVYIAGVPAQRAVAMSLVIVGAVSLVGAGVHFRRGNFHPRAAALLGASGMVAAYFGSGLTHLVSPATLMLLFAALMLVVGARMLWMEDLACEEERCTALRCLTIGAGVGVLTGFLGVGGGFLIVPALVLLTGVDAKKAVGSSLAIISLNSASGVVGQLRFARLDWPLTGAFLAIALVGMWAGTLVVGRISERSLRRLFAWSIVAAALAVAAATLLRG